METLETLRQQAKKMYPEVETCRARSRVTYIRILEAKCQVQIISKGVPCTSFGLLQW